MVEEGETRTLSSKFSETGRTTKFLFNVLIDDEITTVSTFSKEKGQKTDEELVVPKPKSPLPPNLWARN